MRAFKSPWIVVAGFTLGGVFGGVFYGARATRIPSRPSSVRTVIGSAPQLRLAMSHSHGPRLSASPQDLAGQVQESDYAIIADRDLFRPLRPLWRLNVSPSPPKHPAISFPSLQPVLSQPVLPLRSAVPPKPESPPAEAPQPPAQSPPPAASAPPPDGPEVAFTGLVRFGGQEWVLLEQLQTGDGLSLQAGDSAFGVTVVRAEPRRALVRWNGQEIWLWAGVGRGHGKPAASPARGKEPTAASKGPTPTGAARKPAAAPAATASTGTVRTEAQVRAELDEVMKRADIPETYRRVYQLYPQEGVQIAEELRTLSQERGWAAWETRARELGVLAEKE